MQWQYLSTFMAHLSVLSTHTLHLEMRDGSGGYHVFMLALITLCDKWTFPSLSFMSPLSILGESGMIFKFYLILNAIPLGEQYSLK